VPAHDHEFIEICLVLKGTGIHLTENGSMALRENHVLVVPAGGVHSFSKVRDLEVINIYFLPEWFLPEIGLQGEGDGILPLFFSGSLSFRREARTIHEFEISSKARREILRELNDLAPLNNETRTARWIACCCFKVLLLLAEAYRTQAEVPLSTKFSLLTWELLAAIDRVIRSGEKLNLGDQAKKMGMTRDNLCRRFRDQVGKTPTAFYQYRRLQFVCRRLLETDHTLSEIAHQFGYADEAHMCRTFRHELALTPSNYRKKFLSAGSKAAS
jgi:AraC family L-rhamnose operon transcriptional activator RhaR